MVTNVKTNRRAPATRKIGGDPSVRGVRPARGSRENILKKRNK